MKEYIISIKRKYIDKVEKDWKEKVENIESIKVIGKSKTRMTIKGELEDIEKVVGNMFHIEEVLYRERK